MKIIKLFLILILNYFTGLNCFAQMEDHQLRNIFNSVVFLTDSITSTHVYRGKKYEVHLKDLTSDNTFPLKNPISGTGFIINKNFDNYLVTAQHVAIGLKSSPYMVYKGKKGKKSIKIEDLKLKNSNWYFHPNADIAILHLKSSRINNNFWKNSEIKVLDYWDISSIKTAPNRFDELLVIGYPLGLGVNFNTVTPISKKTKVSSDLIPLNRFDNNKPSLFYILDAPSVSGFSGGPVIKMTAPLVSDDRKSYLPGKTTIFGLVHGTLNDPKDKAGRFAAIVPSFLIKDLIDSMPSFNGIHIYKYSNGNYWSKVKFKNGIPWTVFSNFAPDGKPQNEGNLKNGTGKLNIYDENGKLIYVEQYKNGIQLFQAPVMTTAERDNFKINKK